MARPHPDKMSFLEHLEELRVRLIHAAVALCVGILAIAGTLFWFLVRVMARIQLPARRPEERVG